MKNNTWKEYFLAQITLPINRLVRDKSIVALSISAKTGFVPQVEKFGRDISGEQYKKYILLRRGDFAYNKGNSYTYPQGCVYRLESYDEAAVPNVFECFYADEKIVFPLFLKQYFKANLYGKQLFRLINSGVRNNGLLNLSSRDFYSIKLRLPLIEEQRKIVEVLETWDKAIGLTKQLIEQKELQKKYLMQQLLTGRTRLKGFTYEWKESRLNKIKEVVIEKGKPLTKQRLKPGTIPVIAGGQDIPYYHNCWTHDFPCITISASGAYAGFVWIHHEKIWASDCNVLYCTEYDLNFLYFCLKYQQGRLFYLQTGGAQGHVYAGEIGSLLLPNIPLKEQQAIANVLSSCDKGIDLLKQKLAKLEEQKKGLMQALLTGKVRLK